MTLNVAQVQAEISGLLAAHPELLEDEVLREDMVQGSTSAFELLSELVRKIGATQAIASGTADYIGELQQRKARLERREHALRGFIMKIMQTADLKRAELPEATLSIRQGTPKVIIYNENEITPDFLRQRTEVDKSKIRAALIAGEFVPGASLSNAEPSLMVRVT